MISSKSSLKIVLFTFVFFALVVTSEAMASRKGKTEKAETSAAAEKTEAAPAPAQASEYKLTPEEKKTVAEAEEEFKKSKGQAKPSKHMKDKMQSGM